LKHKIEGCKTHGQQHGIIAVVWKSKIGWAEVHANGDLNGFVAHGGSMHIFGGNVFALFIKRCHGSGSIDQLPGFNLDMGGGIQYRLFSHGRRYNQNCDLYCEQKAAAGMGAAAEGWPRPQAMAEAKRSGVQPGPKAPPKSA